MSRIITDSNGRPYMDQSGKVLTVDSSIDPNIQAGNIRNGVSIMGIVGNYTPTLQNKSVNPSTSQQTVSPDSGYAGLSGVSVGAVTPDIDPNIIAGNIKQGVSILGVVGTLSAGNEIQANLIAKTVNKTTLSASGLSVTVAVSGTYRLSWAAYRSYSSGTFSTRAYVDGNAVGTDHTTWTNNYGQQVIETNVVLNAGQVVEIYARAGSTSRYTGVMNLVIEKTS